MVDLSKHNIGDKFKFTPRSSWAKSCRSEQQDYIFELYEVTTHENGQIEYCLWLPKNHDNRIYVTDRYFEDIDLIFENLVEFNTRRISI